MHNHALRPESILVAAGRPAPGSGAPMNQPVVLAANLHHGGPDGGDYVRADGSETIRAFEDALGALDGGAAVAFASGMAAVSAVLDQLPTGAVVVAPSTAYGGTLGVFAERQRLGRIVVRQVDITDTGAVLAVLPGADLLWLETVTNPLMGVPDLPALLDAARAAGVVSCVDATFSTPLLVRPLLLGADVVMHSVTKFLAGHSDLMMGALVAGDTERADAYRAGRAMGGAIPGALECYLALRGLRTLAVRLRCAQSNAGELARRLAAHPAVTTVRYPGLPRDPGHGVAARAHAGFGAMLAFEVAGTAEDAERVCTAVRLISHATSLGGVESLIERRARYQMDRDQGCPETLLRMSVGIEHVEDLWADLAQALG
jgi:cystathionine gamma-synthase